MSTTIRFRLNKVTGEVEEFVVDLADDNLPESEHNRIHDERAGEVGRLLERHPHIEEEFDTTPGGQRQREDATPDTGETESETRREAPQRRVEDG